MDGRCETCKWWGDKTIPRYWYPTARTCLLAVHQGEMLGPDHPESKSHALDIGDEFAQLLTEPDFGCVQWEAKEGAS